MKASKLVKDLKKTSGNVAYVYGMKGGILTEDKFNELKSKYGEYVWSSDKDKIGKFCWDCSGLCDYFFKKGYGSSNFYDNAKNKYTLPSNKLKTGMFVWRKGHIGIYLGNNEVLEARGSAYGTVITKLSERDFTHCLEMSYINYDVNDNIVADKTEFYTIVSGDNFTKIIGKIGYFDIDKTVSKNLKKYPKITRSHIQPNWIIEIVR